MLRAASTLIWRAMPVRPSIRWQGTGQAYRGLRAWTGQRVQRSPAAAGAPQGWLRRGRYPADSSSGEGGVGGSVPSHVTTGVDELAGREELIYERVAGSILPKVLTSFAMV